MDTSSISAITGNGVNSATLFQETTDTKTLGKDAFLKLLINQLKYQNPLNPADSTEFTAQLAQFSSLEQLSNVNENLNTLQRYQASITNAQAVSFIGKEILSKGNGIEKMGDEPVNCEFDLSAEAKRVVVSIYDLNGNFVADVVHNSLPHGRQSIAWDGRDRKGNLVADGGYTFEIQAEGPAGKPLAASTLTRGLVTGITFEDEIAHLLVGKSKIAIDEVIQITQPEPAT